MKTLGTCSAIVTLLAALGAGSAAAQTPPAKTAGASTTKPAPAAPGAPLSAAAKPAAVPAAVSPVIFPLLRLNAKDVAASRKFWVDGLGGTAGTSSGDDAVTFSGGLVLLHKADPAGGSKGSVVDHVAFDVKDIKAAVDRLKKAGFTMVTRAEINSVYVVTDDIAALPDQSTSSAVVMAPDDMKVELVENKQLAGALAFRHIHFSAPSTTLMKDWYVKTLGAKVGARGFGYEGLDLAGKSGLLMFTLANDTVAGTAGRVNDRIGFEVHGAAPLAKAIEKAGGKITRPYGKSPEGAMSVVVTDPWGTAVELTEGLGKI